jgi:hypothetical protein
MKQLSRARYASFTREFNNLSALSSLGSRSHVLSPCAGLPV